MRIMSLPQDKKLAGLRWRPQRVLPGSGQCRQVYYRLPAHPPTESPRLLFRLSQSIHRKQARRLWHLSPFCWVHTIVSDLLLVRYLSKWHPKCKDCWTDGNKTLKIVTPTLLRSSWDKQLCSLLIRPVLQFLNPFTPNLTTTQSFNAMYFLLSPLCMPHHENGDYVTCLHVHWLQTPTHHPINSK